MSEAPARYVNPRSGAEWSVETALWRAPDDGDYVNLSPGAGLAPADIDRDERSLWRYRAAIRLPRPPEVTLGEGWTPLVSGSWDGAPVLFKAEHLMPSGSFKDRGTAVMINYLRQAGVSRLLEDSSGNAGASIAAYAAAAGLEAVIMVPAAAPQPKKTQIAAAGARVEAIPGSREDVATAAMHAAETMFYGSHNRQPFFLEGTKTLAFELWEQLGFAAPDNVVIPLGQGSNVMGCHIGFAELVRCGAIPRLPRLFAVQAAHCAPYAAAWAAGGERLVPVEIRPTIADGIASQKPVRLREVLTAVRESRGAITAVTEAEIVAALRTLSGKGWFVEPTSAAAAAGLSRLLAEGHVGEDQTTVLLLSGHGLKAVDAIGRALGLAGP